MNVVIRFAIRWPFVSLRGRHRAHSRWRQYFVSRLAALASLSMLLTTALGGLVAPAEPAAVLAVTGGSGSSFWQITSALIVAIGVVAAARARRSS